MSTDGAQILCPNHNFNLSNVQFDISVFNYAITISQKSWMIACRNEMMRQLACTSLKHVC